MRHHCEVFARFAHLANEAHQVIRILTLGEAVRPIGNRLGTHPDAVQVWDVHQRLDVLPQELRLHDHRVAAGDQHAVDLGVLLHVPAQLLRFLVRKLQLIVADKLRPTKAVRAVGVTGLALRREKQYRLIVFMLHARQLHAIEHRLVQLLLPRRMRVQSRLNLPSSQLDLGIGCLPADQIAHTLEIRIGQHPPLRHGQLVHRIIRQVFPVDKIF